MHSESTKEHEKTRKQFTNKFAAKKQKRHKLTSRSGGFKPPSGKNKRLYLTPNPSPDTRTSSEERGVHTRMGASERRLFFFAGYFQYPLREGS